VQYSIFSRIKKPSRSLVITGVAVIIALLLVNAGMPALERQLNQWGMLPRHEALTELYFTNASALPEKYSLSTPQTVHFTVQNHEARTMHYRYTVRASSQDKSQKQELDTSSFTLQPGGVKQVSVPAQLIDLGRHVYISVSLSTNEQIGYWVKQG
jgi:uncharacterized membrane protein